MEDKYNVTFCFCTKLPAEIVLNGKEVILESFHLVVHAKTKLDVLAKLKGTDAKIISNISSIKRIR